MTSKATFITDYLDCQEKYEKIYSKEKTLVLIQNGSFYEAYATDTRGHNLNVISNILNYSVTKKNKNIKKVDEGNPYMLGFPIANLSSFLKKLVDANYTVIVFRQVTDNGDNEYDNIRKLVKRELYGIFSPGTFIDNLSPDSNYIVSLYIHVEKSLTGENLYCIGMAALELSIGSSILYESYSSVNDINLSLDDANRFLINYMPKQLLVYGVVDNFVKKYLELEERKYKYMGMPDNNFRKITFINNYLKKIYNPGILTPIEYLGLERMGYATVNFVSLLDYVFKHNERLINNLFVPTIFDHDNKLILGNNVMNQLNIFTGGAGDNKYGSLFDVVNNTSTAMGRRYLKYILANPIVSHDKLNNIYDSVEVLIKDKNYVKVENTLKLILDLERLSRRISLNVIHPYELLNMYESFNGIIQLSKLDFLNNIINIDKDEIDEFMKHMMNTYNLDELAKYNKQDITRSIFKIGLYEDIDELQKEIDSVGIVINELTGVLEKIVGMKAGSLKLARTESEGFFIPLTKARYDVINKMLGKIETIKISDEFVIKTSDIEYKTLSKGSVKMYINQLTTKSDMIDMLNKKLCLLVTNKYYESIKNLFNKYNKLFNKLANTIAYVDYLKSNAKTSVLYNYTRPIIDNNRETSFINVTNMRHPIVERISDEVEYVPHSLELGNSGMLVYGLNGGGKSTIMKAIGLNVIMAQSGLFVPCSKMVYKPYTALFARITGEDNIFRGMSSFTLEMVELSAILKRNYGSKLLVIGDEICRGTEATSGTAIVAASVIHLAKSKASFILATHLHDLATLPQIKELPNVKSVHLSVIHDEQKNCLIYDRKLKDGPGERIYGYIVAKYIIQNKDFMDLVVEIKDNLLGVKNVNDIEVSKYNKEVFIEKCGVCNINNKNTTYDTHHINFQVNCQDGFVKSKPHMQMNSKANLVVLCKDCHIKVHKGLIDINGYLDTSNGPMLDFTIKDENKESIQVNNGRNKKINEEQINYILGLKKENPRITIRRIINLYNTKYNTTISDTSVRKVLVGK